MSFREQKNFGGTPGVAVLLAATCLASPARAQTSFIAPDGRNRYPGVTIFCPSGNGVAPCVFGGGGSGSGGGGSVTVNLGTAGAVSANNRFPVTDPALDGLISGGALSITGAVGLLGTPAVSLGAGTYTVGGVTQAGPWTVSLGAGGAAIGTVGLASGASVSLGAGTSLIGTVTVAGSGGAVSQSGNWTVGLAAGSVVGLASGSSVGLAPGSSVGLASGATVALGAGSSMIGTVTVANPGGGGGGGGAVSESGSWTVGLTPGTSVGVSSLPALAAGGNAIGTVGISNFPGVQSVSGSVSQAGSWTVGLSTGTAVAVSSLPTLPAGVNDIGFVDINSLPALAAGSNAIGTVAVSNFPGTVALSAGSNAIGSVSVSNFPGTVALAAGGNAVGSVSVSNLPATQAVSAAALPLPAGAATAANQVSALAPVAPGAATATSSVVLGCLANTTLPTFNAGQQGAVACDTAGHLYVVTVPSANNVPTYQQAVTSGGASLYRAINAAASAMAANVKSTTGMVYGYEACNSGTTAAYLRLFALAAAPTVGASVPAISKLLPAGACQSTVSNVGLVFNAGIALDVTSGSMADSDTAAVATASQVTVEVYFK